MEKTVSKTDYELEDWQNGVADNDFAYYSPKAPSYIKVITTHFAKEYCLPLITNPNEVRLRFDKILREARAGQFEMTTAEELARENEFD